MSAAVEPSRLAARDLLRVGSSGLRTRKLRAALSGLGIAIGIAALVAVLGVSGSSRADLLSQLDRLGTNLLRIAPGQTLVGDEATLPPQARASIERVGAVESSSAILAVEASVRRTDRIPEAETGGIGVIGADGALLATLGATVADGRWLGPVDDELPTVVLGSVAAERLGLGPLDAPVAVWLGGRWFSVVGVLDPVALAPELDRSAIVSDDVALDLLGADADPSTIYVRVDEAVVEEVRPLLAASADPEAPEEVEVSRPSDALAAKAAAEEAYTSLFLGLGGVALLVGAVGIANVMVIAVLERRREIGLRRALGATRRHVAQQFLVESVLLSAGGGLAGVALGTAVVTGYALARGWQVVVPPEAIAGGALAAVVVGAVAGLEPARRAARLAPTEALRST